MHFKIVKMIATSGFLTALECTKFDFGRCSAPALGRLQRSPYSLAGLRGPTSKRRGEREGRERRRGEKKGGEGNEGEEKGQERRAPIRLLAQGSVTCKSGPAAMYRFMGYTAI